MASAYLTDECGNVVEYAMSQGGEPGSAVHESQQHKHCTL